jgi:hypothetical protein
MKPVYFFVLCLLFYAPAMAQKISNDRSVQARYEELMRKSKQRDRIAKITGATGLTLIVTSLIMGAREVTHPTGSVSVNTVGKIFSITGSTLVLGSFPFFFSSRSLKRKAQFLVGKSYLNSPFRDDAMYSFGLSIPLNAK